MRIASAKTLIRTNFDTFQQSLSIGSLDTCLVQLCGAELIVEQRGCDEVVTSGIDAAIRIGAMLPTCKILLLSGQAATVDLLEHARLRGYEFEILAKPVDPRDLLAKLRNPAVAA
jgi:hypothetical protein